MQTTIVLPELTHQKVTILYENSSGFCATYQGTIVKQGEISTDTYLKKSYIFYKPIKKKTSYQITIDSDSRIAIYNGYIDIDTDHQYNGNDDSVACSDPLNFERSLQSTQVQPIFINRKKEN
jgi:hypothetical protein